MMTRHGTTREAVNALHADAVAISYWRWCMYAGWRYDMIGCRSGFSSGRRINKEIRFFSSGPAHLPTNPPHNCGDLHTGGPAAFCCLHISPYSTVLLRLHLTPTTTLPLPTWNTSVWMQLVDFTTTTWLGTIRATLRMSFPLMVHSFIHLWKIPHTFKLLVICVPTKEPPPHFLLLSIAIVTIRYVLYCTNNAL